jgi:diguanylate cyclase (GGDEF)-like protein
MAVTGLDELARLAYEDPLTGLANRARFEGALAAAVAESVAEDAPMALLYVDLNDFKLVNDTLGHAVGDELLQVVASRLRAGVRGRDLAARLGGDEFVLILRDLACGPGAAAARRTVEAVADRVLETLRAPVSLRQLELTGDASVGASLYPYDAQDPELLRRRADAAMYEAKAAGGGVALYTPVTVDPLARLELAARLRRGIASDELELHYQPIFRLEDRAAMGVEALVRWRDPERGLLAPGEFIGLAEKAGLIDALGEWVFRDVCRQAAEWRAQGLHPHIGVNVAPGQLRRPNVARRFAGIARECGVEPGHLVLELTESAWSLDASRLLPALEAFRAEGFALAMDDFGAGYSSLWRLRELPVQVIKVDRAFLRDVPDDEQAVAVFSAILALAEACRCDVVAEGVETEAQRVFLAERGCRLAQGYVLARPTTAAEASGILAAALRTDRRDGGGQPATRR